MQQNLMQLLSFNNNADQNQYQNQMSSHPTFFNNFQARLGGPPSPIKSQDSPQPIFPNQTKKVVQKPFATTQLMNKQRPIGNNNAAATVKNSLRSARESSVNSQNGGLSKRLTQTRQASPRGNNTQTNRLINSRNSQSNIGNNLKNPIAFSQTQKTQSHSRGQSPRGGMMFGSQHQINNFVPILNQQFMQTLSLDSNDHNYLNYISGGDVNDQIP